MHYTGRNDAEQIISDSFDNFACLTDQPDVDSFAHICLPLRATLSFLCYADHIHPILQRMAQSGKALEVSTKGLRYWLRSLEPELAFLKLYHDLGGELVTIGFDSHDASTVGEGIRDAYAFIAQAGFRYVTRYEAHQPYPVCLDS